VVVVAVKFFDRFGSVYFFPYLFSTFPFFFEWYLSVPSEVKEMPVFSGDSV